MPSIDRLIATLKAMKTQAPGLTTKVGILRMLFSEIEDTKNEGYDYGFILSTLVKHGFRQTTRNQFYGLMNRIRLEHGQTQSYFRPTLAKTETSCQSLKCSIYSKNMPNESMTSRAGFAVIPATVDDLKSTSMFFDIDPTTFD